jgi:hypothetical protein
MHRPVILAVLSFLLLSMQQEVQVHALQHLGSQLTRSHQTELIVPHADSACVECALLAAGTSAAIGDSSSLASAVPVAERGWAAFRSHPADAPAYYSSRAPPVLL